MPTDPCAKCGNILLVNRASTVQGVSVVTLRCVVCGMEREVRTELKPERLRECGAL